VSMSSDAAIATASARLDLGGGDRTAVASARSAVASGSDRTARAWEGVAGRRHRGTVDLRLERRQERSDLCLGFQQGSPLLYFVGAIRAV